MADNKIGSVRILRERIYPLDAAQDVGDINATTVVVPPGDYPVYRDGDTTWWQLNGYVNTRGFHRLGDGLFSINGGDAPSEQHVEFPSQRLGPQEFADLLADPVCVDGPEQRLVFTLDGGS